MCGKVGHPVEAGPMEATMADFPPWGKKIGKGRKVHRVEHERGADYCISENEMWLPGCYDSEETARRAFDVDDAELLRLQRSLPPGSPITGATLDSAQPSSDLAS
jgi:hypothetical protein